jgi:hypothetical protein
MALASYTWLPTVPGVLFNANDQFGGGEPGMEIVPANQMIFVRGFEVVNLSKGWGLLTIRGSMSGAGEVVGLASVKPLETLVCTPMNTALPGLNIAWFGEHLVAIVWLSRVPT